MKTKINIEKAIEEKIRKDMSIQTHIKNMWWQPYFKELSNRIYQVGRQEATKEIIEIILKHKNCVKYHYEGEDGEEIFSCLDIVLRELGYKEKNEM